MSCLATTAIDMQANLLAETFNIPEVALGK